MSLAVELKKIKDDLIMAEGILEVEDTDFDTKVLAAEKPVVVDFWAPWCGPCKAIAPLIEELADAFGDKMTFAKCNVDENPVTPGKYGIQAIPTLMFFKQGNVEEQITGMTSKSKLEDVIQKLI